MNLYEYNLLNDNDKAKILWEKGRFLQYRLNGNEGTNLYSLFDFYVEVTVNQETYNIERIRTFKNSSQLKPYLENINIENLS